MPASRVWNVLAVVLVSCSPLIFLPPLPAEELVLQRVLVPTVKAAEPPVVTAVAFSPDGRVAATAGDDHLVRLWEAGGGTVIRELRGHTDWVRAVAFHPAGKCLASAGDDHFVRIWDAESGRLVHSLGGKHPFFCLAFQPPGHLLAAGGFENELHLFDTETGDQTHALVCPDVDVRAVAVSPDGRWLAAGGRNGCIRVWNTDGFKPACDILAHRQRVRSLIFSGDSRRIVSGGDDRRVCIWNTETGSEISTLPNKSGKIEALVFCGPDLVAFGTTDNSIRLWDLSQNIETARRNDHTGSVAALAYHPVERRLISGAFDATARIWKLSSGGEPK